MHTSADTCLDTQLQHVQKYNETGLQSFEGKNEGAKKGRKGSTVHTPAENHNRKGGGRCTGRGGEGRGGVCDTTESWTTYLQAKKEQAYESRGAKKKNQDERGKKTPESGTRVRKKTYVHTMFMLHTEEEE